MLNSEVTYNNNVIEISSKEEEFNHATLKKFIFSKLHENDDILKHDETNFKHIYSDYDVSTIYTVHNNLYEKFKSLDNNFLCLIKVKSFVTYYSCFLKSEIYNDGILEIQFELKDLLKFIKKDEPELYFVFVEENENFETLNSYSKEYNDLFKNTDPSLLKAVLYEVCKKEKLIVLNTVNGNLIDFN